jgi:hypothetical protein
MHILRVLLLGFIVVLPHGAFAQQREIFDLFGGMIRSGMAAAIQADWERLPNSEVACVDGALRQRGSSINDMIHKGVSPSDPRLAGFRSQCRNQADASGPSFDCRRARSADEIAICSDPELARFDRLIGEGYQDLVARIGEGPARSLAAPLLAARRACGSDVGCIKSAQLSAIRELQQRGATIANAEPPPIPQTSLAQTPVPETPYVVDGLHLGGHVSIGTPAYLAYRCNPSEQFMGLTWCQRQSEERHARGPYSSITTIVHSPDGTALYVNRYLAPAFFAGNEAMDDVRRLAAKYGEPRYVTAPALPHAPRTLMVIWGEVVLQPLDRARLAELAAGRNVRAGILLDHIGNFQRSASMGLPVYRVTGGPGYAWAASWDQNGVGTLRFLTIDASRLAPGAPEAGQDIALNAPASHPTAPQANESLASAPAAITIPPAPQQAAQPSPQPTTSISTPAASDQPAQPEKPNDESLTQAPSAVPVPTSVSPASTAKQPVASQAPDSTPSVRVTDAGRQTSRPPALDQAAQPRVVGPPIAIQPVAKTDETSYVQTNYVQWALVAAVIILIGAIGFLLFERRKRIDAAQSPVIAPVLSSADEETAHVVALAPGEEKALHLEEPVAVSMQEPPPLPIALPATASNDKSEAGTSMPVTTLQSSDPGQSSNIAEHRHFGIGLIAILVTISALMSTSIGPIGLVPLALAVYLVPTIIAFKVRHHYAWPLAAINVFFGFTVLGWLGIFVWALTGPRKSALDGMSQHSALGLSQAQAADPAVLMSDYDLRSGWKMPVVQAEIFSFDDGGPPVESVDSIKVFFKNPVVGIWRSGSSSNSVRYNANSQIRCVAKVAAETKLRVGRTLGRTTLTGIGAAILTGREAALGAAFLDYRFGGDEADEVVAALIVLSDYSSLLVQSESQEFDKFCALLPPDVLSEEVAVRTAEEIDRIKRMAADGPRVIEEMREQISETEKSIETFAEQAKSGETFAERDEGRIGQAQAEERLINERAVLNAVERLIKLASNRELLGRKTA